MILKLVEYARRYIYIYVYFNMYCGIDKVRHSASFGVKSHNKIKNMALR